MVSLSALSLFIAPCRYGAVSMLASARGILAIDLGDSESELRIGLGAQHPKTYASESRDQTGWWEQLQSYVEKPTRSLDAPLDLQGSEFQLDVYAKLQTIALGSTVTYAELARALKLPHGVRAVAGACARNRWALAVPCHRVVGQRGALTGYRWGLPRKAAILRHEAALTGLRIPTLFDTQPNTHSRQP